MLQMRLFALFGCDALAHRSDAAVAWSDLHAVWILARSLWQRPEMMSVTVALNGTRTILAVASKLPPPRPQVERARGIQREEAIRSGSGV
jgi:hypothetical protein